MRTDPIDFHYYERRLDALRQLPSASAGVTLAELGALTERLMFDVAPFLELTQIEQQVNAVDDFDIQSLVDSALYLAQFSFADITISPERTIVASEELSELRDFLAQLQDQQKTLHRQETWFRLEFIADRHLFYLLLCAAIANVNVLPLVERARKKLQHLPEVTLVGLWARVQREFSEDMIGPSMPANDPAVPPNFLRLSAPDELAQKLALYAFSIKPHLVASRFSQGIYTYSLDSMGPARMLALDTNAATVGQEIRTVDIARMISRISALWETILGRRPSELADLLRIPAKSRLLAGTLTKDTATAFKGVPIPERPALAVYELQHFILVVQRYSTPSSPLHQALYQHKLGLEVTLPKSAASFKGKGELTLQKELCRFLLERGIYSEGTKFGPFETDLIAEVQAQAYILEIKLVTAARPPTESIIKAGLTQLQDYMDKRVARPRGVLVIYNLSSTLLVGPGTWLRGRYWITAINLGGDTGSRRRRSLVIEERSGPDLFAAYKIDEIPKARRTSTKKSKKARRVR